MLLLAAAIKQRQGRPLYAVKALFERMSLEAPEWPVMVDKSAQAEKFPARILWRFDIDKIKPLPCECATAARQMTESCWQIEAAIANARALPISVRRGPLKLLALLPPPPRPGRRRFRNSSILWEGRGYIA